jgi:DHA1 family bicyclomycin/chloramphenicol resistance-like MFS transporter
VLLAGLSMVSPFSIDTFFPSFRAMEADLQVSRWQMQQTLTAYMLPYAFTALFHGPLSDALGRRPVIIWGLGFYTLGSLACVLAPNFVSLLAFRACRARRLVPGWWSDARSCAICTRVRRRSG